MSWRDEYKRKLISFEEAAKLVQSGDSVSMGFGPCAPSHKLYEAIIDRHEFLENVNIQDALQIHKTRLYDPEFMAKLDGRINYRPLFGSKRIREMYKTKLADPIIGVADYSSNRIAWNTSILIFQVTPPNEHGYLNFGLANFYHKEGLEIGRQLGTIHTVIAEVNDQMPFILGDNWIHVSEIDYFIENSSPIAEFKRAVPGLEEQVIGEYVADQINDRDTIQMGIGAVPEAVIANLEGKKDLGIITEMFPMGLEKLVEQGIITNNYKPIHKGVTVATFCVGNKAVYDYVNNNPACAFYPASITNNLINIARHPNMKSLNQAIFVDLTGQICSEGIGHRLVSGSGGQPDFQIGAWFSEGGTAMTVLRSAKIKEDGAISSSIVSELPPGTPVTVPRCFADCIITEYGIAKLKNKSLSQRIKAMISIAHPDMRDQLWAEAKRHLLY